MKLDGAPFTCLTHAPPPRPAPRRDSRIPRQPNGPRNNGRFLLTDSRPLRMAEEIVKTAHVPVSFSSGQRRMATTDGRDIGPDQLLPQSRPTRHRKAEEIVKTAHVPVSFLILLPTAGFSLAP